MKELLDEIRNDVIDIRSRNFEYVSTKIVPSRHDNTLTFESGSNKIGKTINTCVLYADIRNSVELNRKHHTQTIGRLYSIFTKSMLKLAKNHSGFVRNIIGDRVMIVFQSENCYKNAVECAISINHVSHHIINSIFTDVDFKCGIGIDYGELKVVKVGIRRKGTENFDNKNLVWVGYPANLASRLTDVANKIIDNNKVRVTYYPYYWKGSFGLGLSPVLRRNHILRPYTSTNKIYHDYQTTKLHDLEDFAKSLSYNDTLGVCYSGGKLVKFEKIDSKLEYPPILMTSEVFKGYKAANPDSRDIKENNWKEISSHNIKDITASIYGASLHWKI